MDITETLKKIEEQIAIHISVDGVHKLPIDGMVVIKQTEGELSATNKPMPALYTPSLCLILKGRKRVYFGKEECIYGVGDFLLAGVDMPTFGCITEAPYLCLKLDLNPKTLTELINQGLDIGEKADSKYKGTKGLFVGQSDKGTLESLLKGFDLLEKQEDLPFLQSLFEKEWHYRLLKSGCGHYVKQMVFQDSIVYKLSRIIDAMKKDLSKPLYVPDCATEVSMSESSFYDHFKRFTGYTPLQYHKNLRLLEAKRLMIAFGRAASQVAYDVGYESSSQFNREYRRFFGLPPLQDIKKFRESLLQYI